MEFKRDPRRDGYIEEARDEVEMVAAYFDCVTPIVKRYNACMEALASCENDAADGCMREYAEMLRCPGPSRDLVFAWRECNERF